MKFTITENILHNFIIFSIGLVMIFVTQAIASDWEYPKPKDNGVVPGMNSTFQKKKKNVNQIIITIISSTYHFNISIICLMRKLVCVFYDLKTPFIYKEKKII